METNIESIFTSCVWLVDREKLIELGVVKDKIGCNLK